MTTFLSLTLCAGACGGRARANDNPPQEKTANPKVYLTRTITPEALVRIYEALGREATGRVAVKLSTGEPGGHHFLQPALVAPLVRKVGGTIVECNTAYGGGRARTVDHLKAAADHGFTAIAAVDIMDAEGETALPVEGGRHLAEDYVGKNFLNYDFTVVLSHFKGHAMGGFGGAIKNISIGIASSAGKAWDPLGRQDEKRRRDVERPAPAGRLPGIDGRSGQGRRRPLRGADPLHQRDEQPLGRLRLRRPPCGTRNGRHRHPRLDRPPWRWTRPASTWSTHRTIPAKST